MIHTNPYFLFLLFPILLFPTLLSASTLTGQIINQTLSAPGAEVPITLIQHGKDSVNVVRDTTDKKGRFYFEIDTTKQATHPPMLSASYAGVDYRYPNVEMSNEPIQISVYETTTVDTAIALIAHHIVIDAKVGEVTQILIFENRSDRTYRTGGDHGHGLEINLPEGVTDITKGPNGLHTHGSLLIDPQPVKPGGGQLAFSFQLPSTHRLVQKIRYPTSSVDVLIIPSEILATGEALQDLGQVTLGEKVFRRFSIPALEKGDHITLQIGSATTTKWFSSNILKWALGSLALVFGLLALFFRSKKTRGKVSEEQRDLQRHRITLLKKIADLDDRLDRGDLSKKEHGTIRNALKEEAVVLTRLLGKKS